MATTYIYVFSEGLHLQPLDTESRNNPEHWVNFAFLSEMRATIELKNILNHAYHYKIGIFLSHKLHYTWHTESHFENSVIKQSYHLHPNPKKMVNLFIENSFIWI